MKPEPFRIEPIFSPRIWGSRSLAPLFPEKTNLAEPIGEAWLTGVDCRVATGPFAGKTLGEAWREMPAEWRGEKFREAGDFPLLVKFIFPKDKLSIQVHPDDAYASVHEKAAGGRGKTEMWHAVHAYPGAHVLIGTKPGVTRQQFVDAIANGNLENLLVKQDVFNGDTFFIPAGTPHTIGPGIILCEVQEYSDLTYRVYDYGRVDSSGKTRELHVQKALDVVQLGTTTDGKLRPLSVNTAYRTHSKAKVGRNVTLLSACRYFAAERWELFEDIYLPGGNEPSFKILVVLSGKGQMGWGRSSWITGHGVMKRGSSESSSGFETGQCWFVPANLPLMAAPTTAPHATMLRAYVPDLPALRSALKRERHSEAAIAKAVIKQEEP